jgi:hypothetical protein
MWARRTRSREKRSDLPHNIARKPSSMMHSQAARSTGRTPAAAARPPPVRHPCLSTLRRPRCTRAGWRGCMRGLVARRRTGVPAGVGRACLSPHAFVAIARASVSELAAGHRLVLAAARTEGEAVRKREEALRERVQCERVVLRQCDHLWARTRARRACLGVFGQAESVCTGYPFNQEVDGPVDMGTRAACCSDRLQRRRTLQHTIGRLATYNAHAPHDAVTTRRSVCGATQYSVVL